MVLAEHEKKEKLETDAMFRLEHGEADRSTLKKALPTLSHIQEAQNAWKDDFALNSMLRRHFREKKKAMLEEEEKDQALQAKASLAIPLVPETEDDRRLAALLRLHTLDSYEDKQRLKRTEIIHRSWFPSAQGPSASSSKASNVLKKLCQGRRPPPSTTGTVGDLGIVRRSRDVPESPQCATDSSLSAEPRGPPGTTQDRLQETAEAPRTSKTPESNRNCRVLPLGSSQKDLLYPSNPSASLVADYSDSESE